MNIVVYTKPNCVQCDATERALIKYGIPHELIDLTAAPDARDRLRHLGYQQAPVVVAGTQHWSGYRPDRICMVAQRAAGGDTLTHQPDPPVI